MKETKCRVGEQNINGFGNIMTIIEYKNAKDITVQFNDGYVTKTNYSQFKNGSVQNPLDKSIYGVGYLGNGKYQCSKNNKHTKAYIKWHQMMGRCYNKIYKSEHISYVDCTVISEWHNFQNFAKWYDENYYEITGEEMNLDKDIIIKGNKLYSPKTCVFVPQSINKLFTKRQNYRGNSVIGVYYSEKYNKYTCSCSIKGGRKSLGTFNSEIEAFNAYKLYKEQVIKLAAEEYKLFIPKILYDALLNYQVEITD